MALKAGVQGDDQEFYDLNGNMVSEQQKHLPVADSKSTDSYKRYIWYFAAIVAIISIIWHMFFPSK
jgi:hypothetical protein